MKRLGGLRFFLLDNELGNNVNIGNHTVEYGMLFVSFFVREALKNMYEINS